MAMTSMNTFKLLTATALLAGGTLVAAEQVLLPSVPPKQFGGSVTPAFEGWYDNADGTHSFLIGYFSPHNGARVDGANRLAGTLRHPQSGRRDRRANRAGESFRAGQSRHGAADALSHRPPLRDVRLHDAERV